MKGYWRCSFYVFLCVGLLFSLVSCGGDNNSTNTDLLVAFISDDRGGPGSVQRYDGTTGASLGTVAAGGALSGPTGLVFGPDGNLYVTSIDNGKVLRYNGTTGAFLNTFVDNIPHGVDPTFGFALGPLGLGFGPDGNLYVSSNASDEVLRYDGDTGAFKNIFVPAGRQQFPAFLTFAP